VEKTIELEVNDLYSSPNILWVTKSRPMKLAGHVAHMGDRRDAYRVLVGKPEGKMDWIDLA